MSKSILSTRDSVIEILQGQLDGRNSGTEELSMCVTLLLSVSCTAFTK